MTSKKELQEKIDALTSEQEELVRANAQAEGRAANLALENARLTSQERRRVCAEREKEAQKRREAEHLARRERLDRIGEGLLPLEGATSRAFVHERDGETGIEVFVPLDDEERRILGEFFERREQPEPAAAAPSLVERINNMARASRLGVFPQFVFAGQP